MSFESAPTRSNGIGEVVITARSFEEYKAMFALSPDDLTKRILDCPGGAAGFTSEGNSRGGDVIACDVAYSLHTANELAATAEAETDRGNEYVRAHSHDYVWEFFADPDEHQHVRHRAVQGFAADIRRNPNHYVAGRLPSLPFPDSSFDLVLSSHLLFSYADRLDHAFHLDAISELMRVTRDEARIFPLVPVGSSEPYPQLDGLLEELDSRGITARIVSVDYEFQRGATHMLVCRH
ncbi:MAG: class I SAM-dependent methyltransferase [Rhodococcus sp.]|nr:class I SAM-dependent methyltransferase [Rhodococcus sp. (in: high G+C Gram-positive bacteria)]